MANCQIGNTRSFFVQNRGKDLTEGAGASAGVGVADEGAWANNPWGCPPDEKWYLAADGRSSAPEPWCQQVLATNSV